MILLRVVAVFALLLFVALVGLFGATHVAVDNERLAGLYFACFVAAVFAAYLVGHYGW